jgi:hypothetical protein
MVVFQFYLQSGKQKSRVGGGRKSLYFGQKLPGVKGSVRRCIVVMQQPVLFSPKFEVKSLHIFTQSPENVTVVCEVYCLACQDELFFNNPLDVKGNDEHALNFALHLPRLFRSRCVWTFGVRLMLPFRNTCLIISRVSAAMFPRFSQNLTHTRCRIHLEIAPGQIHGSK